MDKGGRTKDTRIPTLPSHGRHGRYRLKDSAHHDGAVGLLTCVMSFF